MITRRAFWGLASGMLAALGLKRKPERFWSVDLAKPGTERTAMVIIDGRNDAPSGVLEISRCMREAFENNYIGIDTVWSSQQGAERQRKKRPQTQQKENQ